VNKSLGKTNCMNNRGVQVCSKFSIKSCVLSKLHGRMTISLKVFCGLSITRYRSAWYTLRTHLYEFDRGVTVYEMRVISKKLMDRHGSKTEMLQP
jgi:hypothetical protein